MSICRECAGAVLREAADDLALERRKERPDFIAENYGDDLWATATIQRYLNNRAERIEKGVDHV